jgi:hypothetical protein
MELAEPRAVAAAAVLAVARRVVPPSDAAYQPRFLVAGDSLDVPDDLVELALLALDRVANSYTQWAEMFIEAGTIDDLRDALRA